MNTPIPVIIDGWGPTVSEAVARIEQGFFLLFVLALLALFTGTFAAVAVAFRR